MLLSTDHQYRGVGVDVILIDETSLASAPDKASPQARATPSLESLINTSYDWSLTVPLLSDPGCAIARNFGVASVPVVLLVDPRGRIVKRWNGPIHPGAFAAGIQQIVGGPMQNRPPQAQQ